MFTDKLKQQLLYKYKSLTYAAKMLGVTPSFLSQILNGKKHLPDSLKRKMIQHGIPEELFQEYNWEGNGKRIKDDLELIKSTYGDIIFHQKYAIKALNEALDRIIKQRDMY